MRLRSSTGKIEPCLHHMIPRPWRGVLLASAAICSLPSAKTYIPEVKGKEVHRDWKARVRRSQRLEWSSRSWDSCAMAYCVRQKSEYRQIRHNRSTPRLHAVFLYCVACNRSIVLDGIIPMPHRWACTFATVSHSVPIVPDADKHAMLNDTLIALGAIPNIECGPKVSQAPNDISQTGGSSRYY